MKPWRLPSPSWVLEALKREMADVRGGLIQPLPCTPTLPLAETLALIPVLGRTASSCGTQGHGSCPHLSSALTGSLMAPRTWEVLPLGGRPGTEWPLSGQALPGLRPARPRWPPPPTSSSVASLAAAPLVGSPPAPWAPLPLTREGRVPFLVPLDVCPPTLALAAASLCIGPLLGMGKLPHSPWPPLPELETPQPHRETCQSPSLPHFVVSSAPHPV